MILSMSKRILSKLFNVLLSLPIIATIFAFSLVTTTAQQIDKDAPLIITFAKGAGSHEGDHDRRQIVRFSVPKFYAGPLVFQIFDADTGRNHDEMIGATDTIMRYDLYGLGSESDVFRDSEGAPSENVEGVILRTIAIGSDAAYDDKWVDLFKVSASDGEVIGENREFFILIEGDQGNDGNIINVRLSAAENNYSEIDGSRIYSFLPSVRVADRGRITELGVEVPKDAEKLSVENFDSANGSVTFAGRFRSMSLRPSGQNDWEIGTVTLNEDEKGALVAVNLSGGFEMPNDGSLYVEDDKERPAAIKLPPKQFKLNKRPVIELSKEPQSCKIVSFDARNSFDPDGKGASDDLTFRWYFHDGSQKFGASVEHEYSTPGTYPARLEIFDNSGQIGNGTAQDFDVFVKAPPVAQIDAPGLVAEDEEFTLSALWSKISGNQPDAELETFDWNLRLETETSEPRTISSKTAEQKYTFSDNGKYVIALTVTDNSDHPCNTSTASKFISVNGAPIADAGTGQIIPLGTDAKLSAAKSSDPDGDPLSYSWNLGDGNIANSANVSHRFDEAGTYNVALTVNDNKGASNSISRTDITIVVNAPPLAQMAVPDMMATGVTAQFDASGSMDPDGLITSYKWALSDGNEINRPSFDHAFFEEGTYQVTLTVMDNSGIKNGVQTITKSITVKDAINIPPVAKSTGDQNAHVGALVQFSGEDSRDEDGSILEYIWAFGDGVSANGLTATHVYQKPDTYHGKLTVRDNSGQEIDQASETFVIVVGPTPNKPAIARAGGDRQAYVNEIVEFDAEGSRDMDGSLLSYIWDLGDGNKASGFKVRHSYKEPGSYKVNLLVRDDSGRSNEESEASFTINISHAPNLGPTIELKDRFDLVVDEKFNFNATNALDLDGNIVRYRWNFGDGFTSTDASVDHTFKKPGIYSGTLTLTDNSGLETGESTFPFTIFVSEKENIAPIADAGEDFTTKVGEIFELDGSGSTDKDGNIIRYEWDLGNGKIAEGEKVLFSYFDRGQYDVTLKVIDASEQLNASATDAIVITVLDKDNLSPIASVSPNRGAAIDEPVPFSGRGSQDPDGNIIRYEWDFGDGNEAIGRDVVHNYAKSGRYIATLTIIDDSGLDSAATTITREIIVNEPPVADAGPDQHVTASVVEFDASGSTDIDGDIIRYSWNFGDGGQGEGLTIKHTYREPGTYQVKLEIEDSSSTIRNIDQDDMTVRVNALPIADAGFDIEVAPGEQVAFDGTRSEDPDGKIATYLWDFKDGSKGNGAAPVHTFEKPGTYYVELKVFDDSGHENAFDVSSAQVIVNTKPKAIAGPDIAVAPGELFTLDGRDSFDINGELTQWRWDFSSGLGSSNEPTITGAFEKPGIYSATLTVSDNSFAANNTSQDSLEIFVNHAPIAEAGPDLFSDKLQIVLNGGLSVDADNDGLSYRWDMGDGNIKFGEKITHTYSDGGVYPIILTIDDGRGLSNSVSRDSMTATINRSPIAVAGKNQNVCVGDTVVFDGSLSKDPDNDLIRYTWDFGNGKQDSIINPTQTYSDPGVYQVNLTVEDESGLPNNSHNDALIISVKEAPRADAGEDILACANTSVQFNGTRSTDVDGVVNRFNWQFGDNSSGGGDQPRHTYSIAGNYRATLTIVGDTDGQCSPTSQDEVLVTIVNAPRGVIKAKSQAAIGEWVEFDASRSYAEGAEIETFSWNMGDGTNQNGEIIRHKFDKAGTYRIVLNVVAPDLADQCEVTETIHLIKINEAPIADAGTDREIVAGRALKLNASASSDKDGGILDYRWDLGDGNQASGLEVNHIWRDPGTYTVTLTVKDDSGVGNDTSTDEIKVTVLPALMPEIIAHEAACVGDSHRFSLDNIDNSIDVTSPIWSFGDGASARGIEVEHNYQRAGIYTVTVSGNADRAGETLPLLTSKTVKVNAPPVPVPSKFVAACPGEVINFDGRRSFDKDGEITSFNWNFGNGNSAKGPQTSYAFDKPGTYQVELQVTDNSSSMCAARSETIEVFVNAPPKANAGPDFTANVGGARDRINFDASRSTDADGDGLYYYWTLSNGEEIDGEKPGYIFTRPGNYTAELTAQDPHGLSCSISSDTVEIMVESHLNN